MITFAVDFLYHGTNCRSAPGHRADVPVRSWSRHHHWPVMVGSPHNSHHSAQSGWIKSQMDGVPVK